MFRLRGLEEREERMFARGEEYDEVKYWKRIHVTLSQFEKKRDKDATLQDFDGAWIYSAWRRRSNGVDEVAYKMPYKIDQLQLLTNMEKEHKQPVYFQNEEDKKIGVGYVMNKILSFYKECLELRLEYKTNEDKDSNVILDEESLEALRIFTWTILR
ncbi:hypothetical protein Tco_1523663 [Tanacetum coccineum]